MDEMKEQAKAVGTEMIEDHIGSVNLKSKPFEAFGDSGQIGYKTSFTGLSAGIYTLVISENITTNPYDTDIVYVCYKTFTETYEITQPAQYGGNTCSHASGDQESIDCNLGPCPVNCEGAWSDYSVCDVTCGGGTQNRTYHVSVPESNGGEPCDNNDGLQETQSCNTQECLTWATNSWTSCSKNCGGGTQTRAVSSCKDSNGNTVSDSNCDIDVKPTTSQTCNTQTCLTWDSSEWNTCIQLCGSSTGTSETVAVNPKQVKAAVDAIPYATSGVNGLVQFATGTEVTTGTSNTVAITPAQLKQEVDSVSASATLPITVTETNRNFAFDINYATQTAEGSVRFATAAELTAGTSGTVAISPANLETRLGGFQIVDGTTTVKGLVRFATNSETAAGTVAAAAVSPESMRYALDQAGYVLDGGSY